MHDYPYYNNIIYYRHIRIGVYMSVRVETAVMCLADNRGTFYYTSLLYYFHLDFYEFLSIMIGYAMLLYFIWI